jgi:hypothetical protein
MMLHSILRNNSKNNNSNNNNFNKLYTEDHADKSSQHNYRLILNTIKLHVAINTCKMTMRKNMPYITPLVQETHKWIVCPRGTNLYILMFSL